MAIIRNKWLLLGQVAVKVQMPGLIMALGLCPTQNSYTLPLATQPLDTSLPSSTML